MTTNEYDYLLSSIDEFKEADIAFNHSYAKGEIVKEQVDLYDRLKYQLDEVYIAANMLLEREMYLKDRRKQRRIQKSKSTYVE